MYSLQILISVLFVQTVVRGEDFYCLDGKEIPYKQICDGITQCNDGEDEDQDICPTNEFQCYNGQTITNDAVCNGTAECSDESDESVEKCTFKECKTNMFKCSYGACIDSKFVCDKNNDCLDGSDEKEDRCSEGNKCIIPEQSDSTRYTVSKCDVCKGGSAVDPGTKLSVFCENGYMLHSKHSVATCENGKWIPEVATCHRWNNNFVSFRSSPMAACAAIFPESGTEIRCDKDGKEIICSSPLPYGTIAKISCHDYYTLGGKSEAKCLPNGKWSRPVKCFPTCYRDREVALIVKGQMAKSQKYFPWVAALYAVENGRWTYRCGGTLITDKVMITAAHCVWKLEASDFKVTLGKKYRDYYLEENSQQNFDIERVTLLSVYQDSNGNYGSDLAILIFKTTAQLSDEIHPACIQWDEDYSDKITAPGSTGIVAGWGFTENDKPSDILRYTNIPIINTSQCINGEPEDFRKFITYTSFCAGYNNGTSVCNGDSGSGLIFSNNGNFYLEGIVSISPRKTNSFSCEPKLYTVFTKVNVYKRWIRKILKKNRNN